MFGYVFMFLYGMCINPFINDRRKVTRTAAQVVIEDPHARAFRDQPLDEGAADEARAARDE